jgi:acetyltransferase-like isoleucine patch superfamily enzyme
MRKGFFMISEGIHRIIQVFFGLRLFDFPPFLFIRNIIYQYMFNMSGYPEIEAHVLIKRAHGLLGSVQMGKGVFLGSNVKIDRSGYVDIGNDVWISENANIYTHMHVLDSDRIMKVPEKILSTKLKIEDEVWIGANVIILESVRSVGACSVVGAGSVVTKDVPANAVVAGNPAAVIKYLC